MVISIESAIHVVLMLLGAGLVFALLFWLISYVEREFPGIGPFGKFARIALVIIAVLVLIALILSFLGHPILVLK